MLSHIGLPFCIRLVWRVVFLEELGLDFESLLGFLVFGIEDEVVSAAFDDFVCVWDVVFFEVFVQVVMALVEYAAFVGTSDEEKQRAFKLVRIVYDASGHQPLKLVLDGLIAEIRP